jgi:hypothetical protein
VASLAGPCQSVQSIRRIEGRVTVYNFTVEGAHTYYVGQGQWWVHNQCGEDGIPLYRGLSKDHPQLTTFQETGLINPWGGHSNPWLHTRGATRSNFTSWTKNFYVAKDFAGSDGVVVMINSMEALNTMYPMYLWSIYKELEVLLEGVVSGATVVFP